MSYGDKMRELGTMIRFVGIALERGGRTGTDDFAYFLSLCRHHGNNATEDNLRAFFGLVVCDSEIHMEQILKDEDA